MRHATVLIVFLANLQAKTAAQPHAAPINHPTASTVRGDRLRLGNIDNEGNFVPDARYQSYDRNTFGFGAVGILPYDSFSSTSEVYEYRSGYLIRGVYTKLPNGCFVPIVDSIVIGASHVGKNKKINLHIYNLPPDAGLDDGRHSNRPIKISDLPRRAGMPHGFALRSFAEVSDKKTPCFARVMGGQMELGRLAASGEFVPNYDVPVLTFVKAAYPIVYDDGRIKRSMYYNLPPDDKDSEDVYEFRSGRLIRGTLQKSGNFVPEAKSKVLDFAVFDPATDTRRIYNLPGILVADKAGK